MVKGINFETYVMIEGVMYVFVYHDNSASFYIDPKLSTNPKVREYIVSTYDREWGDYDPPDKIYSHVDLGIAFKLKKHVLKFLTNVVNSNPYFFRFSAYEEKNVELWGKIAKRYADKYGYDLSVDGSVFEFRKRG